jgi:hypothetical protein
MLWQFRNSVNDRFQNSIRISFSHSCKFLWLKSKGIQIPKQQGFLVSLKSYPAKGGYSVTACLVNLVNRVYFKGGTFYEHSNGLPGNRPQSATFPAANRHPSF